MIHRAGLAIAMAAALATLVLALAASGFAPTGAPADGGVEANVSSATSAVGDATAAPAGSSGTASTDVAPSDVSSGPAATASPKVEIVYDNVYIPAAGTPQPADPPQAAAATPAPAAADQGPVVIVRVTRGGRERGWRSRGRRGRWRGRLRWPACTNPGSAPTPGR